MLCILTIYAGGENKLKFERESLLKDGRFITHPLDSQVQYYCLNDSMFNTMTTKRLALFVSEDEGGING